MDETSNSLMNELNELKSEVKMLRAIVQSLMYVITEDQDIDPDMDPVCDERDHCFGRPSSRNYVS